MRMRRRQGRVSSAVSGRSWLMAEMVQRQMRNEESTYKCLGVHDLIIAGGGAVDDELAADLSGLCFLCA